jgi:hypothetical protein
MTKAKKMAGGPAKGPPEGPAGLTDPAKGPSEGPAELTEYLTEEQGLAFVRAKGIPAGRHFFQNLRGQRRGPPTHYFGTRGLLRRDELEVWIPTIFTKKTWNRRSSTEAAVEAKKVKDRAKAMRTGEQRAE